MDIIQFFQSALKNLKSVLSNKLFIIGSLFFIGTGIFLFYKQTPDTEWTTAATSTATTASSAITTTTHTASSVSIAPTLLPPKISPMPLLPHPSWKKIDITIQKGENLSEVFERLGISQEQLQDIIAQKRAHSELTLLMPKEKMELLVGPNHVIEQLNFPINFREMLQVTRNGNDYVSKIIPFTPDIEYKKASGVIKNSFSRDAIRAKLHPKQVKEFSRIFADEINFKKQVKPGDEFSIIYETYYSNKELIGSGDIVAAEYIDRYKNAYRAIRDQDSRGRYNYYTPTGMNLRKAFERYPLVFRRISSPFSLQRAHPVLGKIVRPHKGVDFAAPIGRPVQASGDGQITFAGVKSGFGNTIIIRHSKHYKTLYAHLDHFAAGIRPGTFVQEGQVIAYVGETGIATGPHLHYEFSLDNVPRNPLTVSFPRASGIPAANRAEFAAKVKKLGTLLLPVRNIKEDLKN